MGSVKPMRKTLLLGAAPVTVLAALSLAGPAAARCYPQGVHWTKASRLHIAVNEVLNTLVNDTSVPQDYSFTTTHSRTVNWKRSASLEGEAEASFPVFSASIRSTFSISVERSHTSTKSVTLHVTAAPHTTVTARYGVLYRNFTGRIYRYLSPGTGVHGVGCPNQPFQRVTARAPVGEGWRVYRIRR